MLISRFLLLQAHFEPVKWGCVQESSRSYLQRPIPSLYKYVLYVLGNNAFILGNVAGGEEIALFFLSHATVGTILNIGWLDHSNPDWNQAVIATSLWPTVVSERPWRWEEEQQQPLCFNFDDGDLMDYMLQPWRERKDSFCCVIALGTGFRSSWQWHKTENRQQPLVFHAFLET